MSGAEPTFSLVVNTLDRADQLGTMLRALEHQTYPHFEVVVVVGPTCDHTLEVLSQYDGRVRVLRCPTANLCRSRNIGVAGARGDIVAFIDDDAVPCRTWIEQLAKLFQDPGLDGTGGTVYRIYPGEARTEFHLGICSSLSEYVDARDSRLANITPSGEGVRWVPRMMGTNMAYRRSALLDVGGFDEFYVWRADDSDLALRLANAGKRVCPVKQAFVYHVPGSSRHRTMHSHKVRWWLDTHARVYYNIRNGLEAGDSRRSIARRCRQLVLGQWQWFTKAWIVHGLPARDMLPMYPQEIRAAVSAAWAALVRPRRLLAPAAVQAAREAADPILSFPAPRVSPARAVDPVSGRQPVVASASEPPLCLCLLAGSYPPEEYDGVGRLTQLMARGLFELGHTVHVVARGEKELVSFYEGAFVHRIAFRRDRYARYSASPNLHATLNYSHAVHERVQSLILNEGIQLVDSTLWQYQGLVTLADGRVPVVVRLVTGERQVASVHGDRSEDLALMGETEGLLLQRAHHLLPNTKATLDSIRGLYDLSDVDGRCTIVPYGIVPAPEEQVRPYDVGRVPGPFTVLFVGRLEKRKGIMELFEAIPEILRRAPAVRFVIAGADNSQHDGFLRDTGKDYPTHFVERNPGLGACVRFEGAVSEEELQRLYMTCDLFVAPSRYESFGLVYPEAMNYAKPVIGCRAGGIPEVVDHGVTGLLVDPEAPAALADAIVELALSPARVREMGLAARRQVVERFNYLQMARNFERAYRATIFAFEARRGAALRG